MTKEIYADTLWKIMTCAEALELSEAGRLIFWRPDKTLSENPERDLACLGHYTKTILCYAKTQSRVMRRLFQASIHDEDHPERPLIGSASLPAADVCGP